MMRSTAITLTVLIGLAGCTTPESAPAPSQSQQSDGLDDVARQQLKWAECENADLKDGGVECTTVEVPMDYRDPAGKKITIAIARKQAGDKARRRGVLFTNPGGPGAEGLSLTLALEGQPAAAVYDTIGMDPRGVGKSTQLFCDPHESGPAVSRPTEADFPKYTEAAKAAEAACVSGGGDLRKHITSMNTARDMDLIRRVLGEEKISFLGFSYGTFLGPLYGEMFADHLDRIVLDSTQDPNQSWRDQEKDDVAAHHANVQAWKQWVADRDRSFHLDASPADVQGVLDRFAATLKDRQLGDLDDVTSFDLAVGTAARYRSAWAAFAWALGDLLPAIDGGDVNTDAAGQLAKLAHPDEGHSLRQDEKPNGTYQAILCDWSWPTNPEDYYADMRKA
ncbi:alpha/beta fold hydrolase, partial [Actinokineospora sp.]|uniref:alpha/beta fold hydrolase n=1 Tax=Actinokineospora sp. TaxID=1872133 RepID=UPI003D6B4528